MEELLKVLKELNTTFESIVKPVTDTINKLEKLDEGVKEVTKNTQTYQDHLDKLRSGFGDIQNAARQTQDIFASVGNRISTALSPVTGIIIGIANDIGEKIAPKFDFIRNSFNSIASFANRNFGIVSRAIQGVSDSIKNRYTQALTFVEAGLNRIGVIPIVRNLASGIRKITSASLGIIGEKVAKIKKKFSSIKESFKKLKPDFSPLKKAFDTVSGYVKKFVKAFGDEKKLKALNDLYTKKVEKITKDVQAKFKAALGPIADKIIEFATKIVNGFDTLYKAAEPIVNTVVNLSAVIADFLFSIFAIQDTTKAATFVIDSFKKVIEFLAKPIAFLALGLKIVFQALKPIAPIIGIIAGAWAIWNAVMAVSPITWIVIGVVALISAIAIVIKYTKGWATAWQGFKDILSAVWSQLQENFSFFIDSIVYGFQKAWYNVLDFGQRTIQYVRNVGTALRLAWDGDFSGAKEALTQTITTEAELRLKEIEESRKQRVDLFNQNTAANALQVMEGVKKMGSLSFDTAGLKKDLAGIQKGVALPKTPSVTPTPTDGGNVTNQGINNITDGGKKQTHINVHFDRLVENLIIQSENITEGVNDMEDKLIASLLRVLNSANQIQTTTA